MSLQTEYEFTLPRGYIDKDGNLHKQGAMRLATAVDEITPLRDPRVTANQAYLAIILLTRVITKLGSLTDINTGVVEKLFSADFNFLQDFYRRVNENGVAKVSAACPECNHNFEVDLSRLGG
jgi:hypothetical protein